MAFGIEQPAFDERSIEKLWRHGVQSDEEVFQLLEERPRALRQRNGRYRVIGPTRGGRLLTVIFDPPDDTGAAYVVTGWWSDEEEAAWYAKPGGAPE